MKTFDDEIKKRVQSLDLDIPLKLEESILKEMNEMAMVAGIPRIPHARGNRVFIYGTLAAAAALFMVSILYFFPVVQPRPDTVEACEVFVQSALVENEPASLIVIKQADPDMTIVWVEKIK